MKCKGWIDVVIGLWLLAAVILGFSSTTYSINNVLAGLIVISASFCIAEGKPWQARITGILGFGWSSQHLFLA